MPFPGPSSSDDQVLGEHNVPGGPCVLITFLVPATRFPWCAMSLLWGADPRLQPSWKMSTIKDPRKTWLATGSLLTVWWSMLSLGPRLQQPLAYWLWLLHTCLSASRGRGGACMQLASSPLVFTQSFVLVADHT